MTPKFFGSAVMNSGALGQWIFVVPRHQLVFVSTGDNNDYRATDAVEMLFSHVLPSIPVTEAFGGAGAAHGLGYNRRRWRTTSPNASDRQPGRGSGPPWHRLDGWPGG